MIRPIFRYSIILVALFFISLYAHAQGPQISFPGVASTVVGDVTELQPQSSDNYTGPASGLVLYQPLSVVVDAQGDIFILTYNLAQSGDIVFVVASGKGPIPSLPSVPNPQANTVYPLAGQGASGCANPADGFGDGCLATQSTFVNYQAPGLAVDANGNLYIADFGDGLARIVYAAGAVPGLSNPTPGFIYALTSPSAGGGSGGPSGSPAISASIDPVGMETDTNGNIYISDPNYVLWVIYSAGSVPDLPANPVPGNIYAMYSGNNGSRPTNIATDSGGNVYFSDNYDGEIFAIFASGSLPGVSEPVAGNVYTVAGGGCCGLPSNPENGIQATEALMRGPGQVALNQAGDLYIPENFWYDNRGNSNEDFIYEVDATGILTTPFGTPSPGCGAGLQTDPFGDGCLGIQASLSGPTSVAVGPTGNLFIADLGDNLIRELSFEATTLTFGTQKVGTTSPVQTVTLVNSGQSNLVFTGIVASSQFAIEPSGGTDCEASQPVAPGGTCEIGVSYTPTAAGSPTGTVTITSNATNATNGENVVSLNGTTKFIAATTLTSGSATSSRCCFIGQLIQLTASVSPVGGVTPTGAVTFSIGGSQGISLGSATLSNGSAGVSTHFSTLGTYSVLATYSGDSNYQGTSTGISLPVGPGVWMTTNPSTVSLQPGQSQPVTLTVTPTGVQELSLTCVPSAPGLTCNLSTSVLAFTDAENGTGTPQQVAVTLTAVGPAQAALKDRPKPTVSPVLSAAMLAPGLFGLFAAFRRKRLEGGWSRGTFILALIVLGVIGGLTSCSSGSSGSRVSPQPVTQTVTITALSTSDNYSISSTSMQVTVQ
jgi:hypothetical protein